MRASRYAISALLLVSLLALQTNALGAAEDRRRTVIGKSSARYSSSSSRRIARITSASSRSFSSASVRNIEHARAGLLLRRQTITLTDVTLVTMGSSAEKAGIRANDVIIAIDDQPVSKLFDVNYALYGPKGSTVRIRYRHGNTLLTANVVRDTDTVLPAQEWTVAEPEPGIFVLRIGTLGSIFRDTYRTEMRKIADRHPKGIILDLRSTFAGDIPETLLLLGALLPQGTIAIHCAKATLTDRLTSDPPIFPTDLPVIALINGGTTDDAESIANALSIHHRATLVGETTNGNGYAVAPLGQNMVKENARIPCKFTDALGQQVAGTGVNPDIPVSTFCARSGDCMLNEALALIKRK